MSQAAEIYGICQAILGAIVDHYDTIDVDLPAVQLVTPGLPAFDCCDMLTVWCEGHAPFAGNLQNQGADSIENSLGFSMRFAQIGVTLIRSAAVLADDGEAPPVAEIQADAQTMYADSMILMEAIIAGHAAGALGHDRSIMFGTWLTEGPEGGTAGGTLRLQVSLADWLA